MADLEGERKIDVDDAGSRGMQEKTTEFLRRQNEVKKAYNTRFDTIGAVKKSPGYEHLGSDLTSTSSTSTSTSTTTTSTSSSTSTTRSTSTTTT